MPEQRLLRKVLLPRKETRIGEIKSKRLTEHICAELEGLKGQNEQKNELLADLQRDVLRVHVLGLDV
jgi:hypothetical protein